MNASKTPRAITGRWGRRVLAAGVSLGGHRRADGRLGAERRACRR